MQALGGITLVLPMSSSCCERGFSCMKWVISDWRSRLSNDTLNSLIQISIHCPDDEYNSLRAVNKWWSCGRRSRRPQFCDWGCWLLYLNKCMFGINVFIVINIMYRVFLILSVSINSKCKKRFSRRFGTIQNDFQDVSGTMVKKVHFNPCLLSADITQNVFTFHCVLGSKQRASSMNICSQGETFCRGWREVMQ